MRLSSLKKESIRRIKYLQSEINYSQSEINKEQKKIDELNKKISHSCLFFLSGIIIVISTILLFIINREGLVYVIIGIIIVLPASIVLGASLDREDNERYKQEILSHKREIKKLNKSIYKLNEEMNEYHNSIV